MNLERINRRFYLKEASQRLIEPVKRVVEEAMTRLKDGVFDSFGRKRIALINDATNRIYLLSDVGSNRKPFEGDCGLFVQGIQLDDKGMPEKRLFSIQLPLSSKFVTQSSIFLLRGILPRKMRELAKDIGLAKTAELQPRIYGLCSTLLGEPPDYQT